MITRIEYQSANATRSATVLFLRSKEWHVTRRTHDGSGKAITAEHEKVSTLTSAQGKARTWVQGEQ